jgi:hypothetical protein
MFSLGFFSRRSCVHQLEAGLQRPRVCDARCGCTSLGRRTESRYYTFQNSWPTHALRELKAVDRGPLKHHLGPIWNDEFKNDHRDAVKNSQTKGIWTVSVQNVKLFEVYFCTHSTEGIFEALDVMTSDALPPLLLMLLLSHADEALLPSHALQACERLETKCCLTEVNIHSSVYCDERLV